MCTTLRTALQTCCVLEVTQLIGCKDDEVNVLISKEDGVKVEHGRIASACCVCVCRRRREMKVQ